MKAQISDNESLRAEVMHQKQLLESANATKSTLEKKAQASQRQASETRRLTAEDLFDLEQVPSTQCMRGGACMSL